MVSTRQVHQSGNSGVDVDVAGENVIIIVLDEDPVIMKVTEEAKDRLTVA
jgi:hypothetical protein